MRRYRVVRSTPRAVAASLRLPSVAASAALIRSVAAYPSGIVPVFDATGGPENPGECGTARGSGWLALNTAKDIFAGGWSGAKALQNASGWYGLDPESEKFALGLGALGGMAYGAYGGIQDYQKRCVPKPKGQK